MTTRSRSALLAVTLLFSVQGVSSPVHAGETIARLIKMAFDNAAAVTDQVEKLKLQRGLERLWKELADLESAFRKARAEAARGRLLDEAELEARLGALSQRRTAAVEAFEKVDHFLAEIETSTANAEEELSRILEEIDTWGRSVRSQRSQEERASLARRAGGLAEELELVNKEVRKLAAPADEATPREPEVRRPG